VINDAERRGGQPDAEGERCHRQRRRGGFPAQPPQTRAQVAAHRFEPAGAAQPLIAPLGGGIQALPRGVEVAEAAQSFPPRKHRAPSRSRSRDPLRYPG